jgi:PAS domain S-box-containing protein
MSAKTTRFEKLLEAVPDALVGMDQKGVIRFVNRQTESLFGYDRDQLIGQRIETLVPESLWQIYTEHRKDYFADPRTRSSGLDVELSGRNREGTEFPVNISLSHIDTGDVLLVITAALDVTQQKQAVKNAQLTAAIVQYSDDAIIGSTLEGMITNWNPAAERMYGYSAAEIIGRSARLLTPEDQAGLVDDLLVRIKDGQAVDHLETTLVRKDGTGVPVSITIAPIRDEDGVVVGVSGVHRDVTEQRQAFETAQCLARIVESSDDAIIGETLEGIVTSWNPAAARMFGYSGAEIVGRSARLLVPEGQTDQFESVRARVYAGQHVEHLETINVRKDGTVFPVSITVSPIRDEGAIVGASVICRDVSEQRQAFEAAQRVARIVESSDDAIIGFTPDGIVTSWNPAAEKMYGYSSQEAIGTSVFGRTPEDRIDEIKSIVANVRDSRYGEHHETERIRKDGTVVPVSFTISPILDEEGVLIGVSVFVKVVKAKGS